MATGIGAAMAGGKRGTGAERPRQHADWYPTPDEVTEVLIPHLNRVQGPISEPCCGDGALAKVLERHGHEVIGTDLHYRGYGVGHGPEYDIMKMEKLPAPNVITNPPFNIAGPIIKHVLSLKPDYMAMLLKASFWHAKSRHALFEQHPPSKIIALTWRPDFMNLKRPTMEVIWCVWDRGHNGHTEYVLAKRPPKSRRKSSES
ncbi:hypothetical protein [Mesorhizobium sp. SP-1A]|uniref:hypothetical protein n=1 Tax=Mesorhizobium sp. SP-1A TaxID=3077840 RepID=UPI0028F73D48|nr:hypothetical protein [Mesorhizobium sp. SP-1A]